MFLMALEEEEGLKVKSQLLDIPRRPNTQEVSFLSSEDYLLGIRRVFTSFGHSLWRASLIKAESSRNATLWPDGLYL